MIYLGIAAMCVGAVMGWCWSAAGVSALAAWVWCVERRAATWDEDAGRHTRAWWYLVAASLWAGVAFVYLVRVKL